MVSIWFLVEPVVVTSGLFAGLFLVVADIARRVGGGK